MIMKKVFFTAAIMPAFIFFSCTTAYIPTELNTPVFHESNEIRGGISYGNSGTNLQLGYSFYKSAAVIGEISYLRTTGDEPVFQRNWGFGLGYFNKLHKDNSVYYEVFTGFDIGETRSSYKDQAFTNGAGYENSRYYRIFIQPDISFPFRFIDLIVSMKLNYFQFTDYEHHTVLDPELPRAISLEPAFTFRIGSEYVKLKYQIGLSYLQKLQGSDFNHDFIFMHFGLAFSL